MDITVKKIDRFGYFGSIGKEFSFMAYLLQNPSKEGIAHKRVVVLLVRDNNTGDIVASYNDQTWVKDPDEEYADMVEVLIEHLNNLSD